MTVVPTLMLQVTITFTINH